VIPAVALALIFAADKEERLDHHGAVGLLVGVSGLRKEANGTGIENTWRGGLDLGVSFNVGYTSNEILLVGNMSLGSTLGQAIVDGQVWGGFRGYFGDRWKTFFDLDVALGWDGRFTAGPRFGVGVQCELSPLAGLFAAINAQVGFGQELMWKALLTLGVQLRSFLLE
jgi:hypothetical protein